MQKAKKMVKVAKIMSWVAMPAKKMVKMVKAASMEKKTMSWVAMPAKWLPRKKGRYSIR